MTRFLLVLAASAAAAALLPLAPAAPVPRDAKTVLYYPTTVGTKLVYDRDGDEETLVVKKVEPKGDGWMVTCEARKMSGTEPTVERVHVGPKGVFLCETNGYASDPPLCLLKLPFEGAAWDFEPARGSTPAKLPWKCAASKGGKVKAAAGEFETVKVDVAVQRVGSGTLDITIYLAEGLGPVKSAVKMREGGKALSTIELKSFTPGK